MLIIMLKKTSFHQAGDCWLVERMVEIEKICIMDSMGRMMMGRI
jgi:hypothetical protein